MHIKIIALIDLHTYWEIWRFKGICTMTLILKVKVTSFALWSWPLIVKVKVTFCSTWSLMWVNMSKQPTLWDICRFKWIYTMNLTFKVKVTFCSSLSLILVYISKSMPYDEYFGRSGDLRAFALWHWPLILKVKVTFCSSWSLIWVYISKSMP